MKKYYSDVLALTNPKLIYILLYTQQITKFQNFGGVVLKAILIDDERLALRQLKLTLEQIDGIDVIGLYQDPMESVHDAANRRPDVAFIDIQMPEINGMEVGLLLQEKVPGIELVFVTAYDQYAVRAFELNAVDYLLKPIQKHRLKDTVVRLQKRIEFENTNGGKVGEPKLCFMNNIQIQWPGHRPEMIKWRTAKTKELFAYLFHHRNRVLSKEGLMELFWPDTELEKSIQLLYNSIYHIRRTLKQYRIDQISVKSVNLSEGYMLDLGGVPVDVVEWERELRALPPLKESSYKEYERVLNLYTGDYLGDTDYVWAEQERERLRRLWLEYAFMLSEFFVRNRRITDAIRIYHQILSHDPYNEDCCFSLMKLYASLGHTDAVKKQYHAMALKLQNDLDAVPNDQISQWYHRWLKNVSGSKS